MTRDNPDFIAAVNTYASAVSARKHHQRRANTKRKELEATQNSLDDALRIEDESFRHLKELMANTI